MKVKLLNKQGKWRHPERLRAQVYMAWQRYEKMLDRKKAAFIKREMGEASRYKERLTRYQDRVCEGVTACHERVRLAFEAWEETELCRQSEELEMVKDNLLGAIEDGSYKNSDPMYMQRAIEKIANTLPYVKRCKCKKGVR